MKKTHQILNYLIAAVWLINGLFCKVFNLVPRHSEIVGQILGTEHPRLLTIFIGVSETIMAAWILCRFWTRINAITQVIIIAIMNTLEFIYVPDLLLWGKWNAFFAFLFIVLICYNEFRLNKHVAL